MSAALNKLPAITLAFWVMKICATTLGETAGDLLSMTLNIGYALSSLILLSFFIATLAAQLVSARFHPLLYWMVILSTSTAGTTISDYMDRTLGLGYATGSSILITVLVLILLAWRFTTGSISVNRVDTRQKECFYWAAILASNTLGTAFGDYLADNSGLGFSGAALAVSAVLVLIVVLYRFTHLSRSVLFWLAFILTRPLGATVGDLLTKPLEKGGLNFGTIGSSAILAAVLVIMMVLQHRQQKKAEAA